MKVIIIGAVAAGSKAAAKLSRLRPDWDINIYTEDAHVAYSECGMPFYLAGNFSDYKKLFVRTPSEFEEKGIRVFLQNKIIKILPETKEVLVKNLVKEKEYTTNYDKLIIATGAVPFIPEIKNVNCRNVFALRTIESCIAIKKQMVQSNHVTIIGSGYIAVELLEAFIRQGLLITLLNKHKNLMNFFDPDISKIIQKHILKKNLREINLLSKNTAIEFVGDGYVNSVKTQTGIEFPTDMVVIATGIRPNVKMAVDSGIELGSTGAIKVNKRMETNIPDIYACGDCVEKFHIVANAPVWIPLGSTANKEGRCAAINVAGDYEEFNGVLGSAVTRYFNFTMSMTGLTEKDAFKYGFEPVSVLVAKSDKSGFMPEAENITIKLIADKKTKRLLGAQAVGIGDADKRVNTLTSALLSNMTIEDFFRNDMTYAPPFSTSIDPVLIAAQELINKLNKS